MSAPDWKPAPGDTVWLFDECGKPHGETWRGDELDLAAYEFGNVFPTERDCLTGAAKASMALLQFRREAK